MLVPTVTADAVLINNLYRLTLVLSVLIFILVEGLLLYVATKFRRQKDTDMPVQVHGNNTAEILWTIGPALLVAFLFFNALNTMTYLDGPGSLKSGLGHVHALADKEAARRIDEAKRVDMVIEVTARQWFWNYNYKANGVTVNSQNNGELVVPAGKTVRLDLSAADVLHAWFVPSLGGMTYVNPGERSYIYFNAPEGNYYGQCNVFCGNQHAQMISRVRVLAVPEFDAWVKQKKAEQAPSLAQNGDAERGAQLYMNGGFSQIGALNAANGDMSKAAQLSGMQPQQVADLAAYLDSLK
jgi:cytochrome c oxidase subunit 2